MGQGIWFNVAGTWSIGERKIKSRKKQRPASLARVQTLSGADVFQIFMISPHHKRNLGTLQPVSPLL